MKTALITGITGQDGAYLAEFLLQRGYRVIGTYRRTSTLDLWRLQYLGIDSQVILESMDMEDMGSQIRILSQYMPDEVYNFAAQSFVGASFGQPIHTANVTGLGVTNLLEAIRIVNPKIRFYQASTAEMFGQSDTSPLDETTPFAPRSPYGVAKLFAHWMTVNYRESYGMYTCSGIAFNHESPIRGIEFVTRKITDGVAQIKAGKKDKLILGNLDAKRDWGLAREYVEAMWLMLQQDVPADYVIATGVSYSVKDFVSLAFQSAGIDHWMNYVETGERFTRPSDIELLAGNPEKAGRALGWQAKSCLHQIIDLMVKADIARQTADAPRFTLTV